MTGLCKDCRWWERRRSSVTWRPCVLTRVHKYTEEHPESHATAVVELVEAYVVESFHTQLLTTPEFGCVQFTAKP